MEAFDLLTRQLVRAARKLEREQSIEVRAVWSHLACADRPRHPSVAKQIAQFEQAVAIARTAGLDPPVLHLGNSAAALAVLPLRDAEPGLAGEVGRSVLRVFTQTLAANGVEL